MKICSTEEIEKKTEEIAKLKQQQNETEQRLPYLQSLLDDSSEMLLYDKATNQYSTYTVMWFVNLTNNKVPSEKVSKVIQEVPHLCGKTLNAVLSATTVKRIVNSKVTLSHK